MSGMSTIWLFFGPVIAILFMVSSPYREFVNYILLRNRDFIVYKDDILLGKNVLFGSARKL